MGSCQNDPSCSDELCLSPLLYGLCSCGVSWIWSCWSNGKPACQWKHFKSHRTVWLKPDQRYDEEQLYPLGSCTGWDISVMWSWILTSYNGSLWLKCALDLYSSTCFHADLYWERGNLLGLLHSGSVISTLFFPSVVCSGVKLLCKRQSRNQAFKIPCHLKLQWQD